MSPCCMLPCSRAANQEWESESKKMLLLWELERKAVAFPICQLAEVGRRRIKVPRDLRIKVFFHESVSPKPLSISLGPFRIFSKIRGDIRSSRCTTGVVDTGGAPWLANISAKFWKNRNQGPGGRKTEAKNLVTLSRYSLLANIWIG